MQRHFIYNDIQDWFDQRYERGEEVLAEKKQYGVDLVHQLRPPTGGAVRCLDIGCGTGRITQQFVDLGYETTGADISPVAIERLRSRGIAGFVHNVADPLPLDDESQDIVWNGDMLELVPDMFRFMAEMHRVLRPGGLLVFTTPHMGFWYYRLAALVGKCSSDMTPPSHVRFWTKHGINYFFENEFFELDMLAGVAPLPSWRGKRYVRRRRLSLLCRDIVGVAHKRRTTARAANQRNAA
ncbi:MAG: class I SAM-dependent methyltransferase [Pirellulaceae bacterium]|jgi:SAM-dependent methyltransferase|nr:class I SAM-dependent methyltransferase [Pirellulaceae bacterium]MDP7017760.1 class I SAM-dependent methyltransferase [Pirellulaceae bacterium]